MGRWGDGENFGVDSGRVGILPARGSIAVEWASCPRPRINSNRQDACSTKLYHHQTGQMFPI
ncbi:hypothetical protein [Moorena producens]|uniref:hypothetical protein n=1 Tax=Moorena producens TaxID=1155739 RepID=UPI00143B32CA|nr:hypothetical protein [Moorena producens]